MQDPNTYINGQIISKIENNRLTYYFKTGIVKAEGAYLDGMMENEWKFYREDGQLWQIGHFNEGEKLDPGFAMIGMGTLNTMSCL